MKISNRSVLFALSFLVAPLACPALPVSAVDVLDPNIMTIKDVQGEAVETFSTEQLKTVFSQQTYNTRTPWTAEGETVTYRGPLLADVLSKTGQANGASVRVTAYDDFYSDITMDEIGSYHPIIAVERNCTEEDRQRAVCAPEQEFRPISMVEKGPMFMVWPYDSLPDYYHPSRNAIWVFFPISVQPLP
jgi:hypothetical protein